MTFWISCELNSELGSAFKSAAVIGPELPGPSQLRTRCFLQAQSCGVIINTYVQEIFPDPFQLRRRIYC